MISRQFLCSFLITLLSLALASVSHAQIASTIVRVGEPLPNDPSNSTVTNIDSTTQNQVGGIAFNIASESGDRLWHKAADGTVSLISTSIIGDLEQSEFEDGSFGVDNDGNFVYSAITNKLTTALTRLDGVWKNNTVILNEPDAIPGLSDQFSTFNSRPNVLGSGQPYWVGGFGTIQGGSTQTRGIFFGEDARILLQGGDRISGVSEVIIDVGISLDTRISENGNRYITEVVLDSNDELNNLMVMDGAAISLAGSLVREGTIIPFAIGGRNSEAWDNFDFLGINNSGAFMITGDTDGSTETDEFVANQDGIQLREGDKIDGLSLMNTIDSASMNQNGDIALFWHVEDQNEFGETVTREVLILNGKIVLKENDAVDWNGDGRIDSADNNSTLIDLSNGGRTGGSVKVGPRDENENVVITFVGTASTPLGDREAGFKLTACASSTQHCENTETDEFCAAIKAQNNKVVLICL